MPTPRLLNRPLQFGDREQISLLQGIERSILATEEAREIYGDEEYTCIEKYDRYEREYYILFDCPFCKERTVDPGYTFMCAGCYVVFDCSWKTCRISSEYDTYQLHCFYHNLPIPHK